MGEMILTTNIRKFGVQEKQHVGVGIIFGIKEDLSRGRTCDILVEERLDGGLWTTGNDDSERKGWVISGLEQHIEDLGLVRFLGTRSYVGRLDNIDILDRITLVKAVNDDDLWPWESIWIPPTLPQRS